MQFEEAMLYFRDGKRIYRTSLKDGQSLCGTEDNVKNSYDMTIFDILAEDWAAERPKRKVSIRGIKIEDNT